MDNTTKLANWPKLSLSKGRINYWFDKLLLIINTVELLFDVTVFWKPESYVWDMRSVTYKVPTDVLVSVLLLIFVWYTLI